MENKVKGIIVGILLSAVGALLWIILYLLGFLAGLAGGLIGILFIVGYRKFNKEEKNKFSYIFAVILTIGEILVIELLFALVAYSSGEIIIDEIISIIVSDLGIGYLLSGLVLGSYIYSDIRKRKILSEDKIVINEQPKESIVNDNIIDINDINDDKENVKTE